MKRYFRTYFMTVFILNIVFLLFDILVRRRSGIVLPFFRLEISAIIMAIFIALAIWIFNYEKGNSIINVILGYMILIPSLYVFRHAFGAPLFRFTWYIYIIMIIIGIIYGIVVLIVSKKYKDEVNELNRLLKEKEEKNE